MNGHQLPPGVIALVCRATGADDVVAAESVQDLWSGYGQILRCHLDGADHRTVIVKHVQWPDRHDHPRGWSTGRSHERKVESYRVERAFYERYALRCGPRCRVPVGFATRVGADDVAMVLEDVDASGFAGRRDRADGSSLDACLQWLATFHATFLGEAPLGLWPTGTYWHLATRPDELAAMPAGPLKTSAQAIDERLAASPFKTLVHGDAKLANFCFSLDGATAAAVDFQYVGGGCGMKDLVAFFSSCLGAAECERRAPALLDRYFSYLHRELGQMGSGVDADALEADWRALYPFAWADFTRFLAGWSPGHWKLHDYSERLAAQAIAEVRAS